MNDILNPLTPHFKRIAPIACVVIAILAGLAFTHQMRVDLNKPKPISYFGAQYTKLAEKSALHRKVLDLYAPCSLAHGMWGGKYDVIANDCMTKTMFEMDELNLPRSELFAVQMDIRKAELDLSERIIHGH